ncbi:AAA family ATPase [Endozoicomonas gorgoniicola]|uniref:AAA family ATPase n=1 Tax=Endozoicomonas gorgoniicola TaxID=1234144 RepID=A0ABT3MTW5_9GAMM|nr:AAA family ATPase [Endozoicomonas gorgoniicola]MCW7552805.1 AAA family ATPase [Endozoicomonas gorgoniicola]
MLSEVMSHYEITREFDRVDFFETEEFKNILQEVRHNIQGGRLIALTGIVGCGKTRILSQLHETLKKEKNVVVCQSLSVEKNRLTLGTLITALFCDLRRTKTEKLPSQPEQRERHLRDMVKNKKKPVVLFVDEAHDLHGKTLVALKRLIEVMQGGGGVLSIVLAGHPKLSNDLKRPTMEEIGARATAFILDGIQKQKKEYIDYLFKQCLKPKVKMESIIKPDAIDFLASQLSTPLQIHQYLNLALTEGYRAGIKPVTEDLVKSVLAFDLNGREAQLIRQGYDPRTLAEALDIKVKEARSFIKGGLNGSRRDEIMDGIKTLGIVL